MIQRTPNKGENRAKLFVEFHRRTGVLQRPVELDKINGYLVEHQEEEENPRYVD